jgi:Na+/H+-dicarboxylate symporter
MSLSTRILLGLSLGVLTGIFFGEKVEFLDAPGMAFIRLLQMSVIPYIVVSLIMGLGRLTLKEIGILAIRAGSILLVIWVLILCIVLLMPIAFPQWESASFFSTSAVQEPLEFNLLTLYIPSNPFHSLANTIVPAIVLFSIALGVALTGIRKKEPLLSILETLATALSSIIGFVVRLAPIGVFCLVAAAAGTMDLEELVSLTVYLVTYLLVWIVAVFWLLPGLVTSLTSLRYRDIIGPVRDALVTAFATGSLLVVLPMLGEKIKGILNKNGITGDEIDSTVDIIVPTSYSFPLSGTLLYLGFVLFAGWFVDQPLSSGQYLPFAVSGLFSSFGSPKITLPLLLDMYRLPADMFELFLIADVMVGRFAILLSAMHVYVLGLLVACSMAGKVKVHWQRIGRYFIITVTLAILALFAGRVFLNRVISHEYQQYDKFMEVELLTDPVNTIIHKTPPVSEDGKEMSTLDRILKRGSLRVGYFRDSLPFVFHNSAGRLVGFDVELSHRLARDLNLTLEYLEIKREEVALRLNRGDCDIVMSGMGMTAGNILEVEYSQPYQFQTLAFVVKDHRRREFGSRIVVCEMDSLRVGVLSTPYYTKWASEYLPKAEIVHLQSPRQFFRGKYGDLDAFIFFAEAGAAWTLVYPSFSVVVPHPGHIRIPMVFALRRGNREFVETINHWLELHKADGTIDKAFDHWILGRSSKQEVPRWSVIRDVLGWLK